MAANSTLTVGELTPVAAMPDELQAIARERNAQEFLRYCIRSGKAEAGLQLLTSLMATPYLVDWIATCLEMESSTYDLESEDPILRACLDTVDRWLADSDEADRRALLDLAERADYSTPSAWLAACVGWSGGSILPPDQEPVEAGPDAKRTAALAALRLIAARVPEKYEERLASLAEQALSKWGISDRGSGS